MANENITPNKPITISAETKAEVKQQLEALKAQAKEKGLDPQGGFIFYHRGAPDVPEKYEATVTFIKL